jgi:hypothetical protein
MSRNLPPRYLDFLYGSPLQPGQVLGSPASGTGPLAPRTLAQTGGSGTPGLIRVTEIA